MSITMKKPAAPKPFSMLGASLTRPVPTPSAKAVRKVTAPVAQPKPSVAAGPLAPPPRELVSEPTVTPPPALVPYVETDPSTLARIAALALAREQLPETFNDAFPPTPADTRQKLVALGIDPAVTYDLLGWWWSQPGYWARAAAGDRPKRWNRSSSLRSSP